MEFLIQFQIHLLALVILFVLFLYVRLSKIKSFSKRIAVNVIFATGLAIILEPLTWFFDGKVFSGSFYLEYLTNFLLFLVAPVIGGLMISYVDYRINHNRQRIYKRLYYQHLTFLTLVLLLVNVFYPIYFSVDFQTVSYTGGAYEIIHYVIVALAYIYMVYMVVANKQVLSRYESNIYISVFAIPIIGMFVQLFYSRLHLSWNAIAIAVLVVYIFLETSPSEEDYLTKLYNRRSLEQHMRYLIQVDEDFVLVLFDLNKFKSINDTYGHGKGDDILRQFALCLKTVFEGKALVSRLGGDEFAVVVEESFDHVNIFINQIQKHIKSHADKVYRALTFSYGYLPYEKPMTMDDLYAQADKRMYANKDRND